METLLEACASDESEIYGMLSDDYDCVTEAVESIEDDELSAIVDDDDDDEILSTMGIDINSIYEGE